MLLSLFKFVIDKQVQYFPGVDFINLFAPYAEKFVPYDQLLRSFLLG